MGWSRANARRQLRVAAGVGRGGQTQAQVANVFGRQMASLRSIGEHAVEQAVVVRLGLQRAVQVNQPNLDVPLGDRVDRLLEDPRAADLDAGQYPDLG